MGFEACNSCNKDCKYFGVKPKPELRKTQEHGGYKDRHHAFWPKGFYKTAIEQAFRNLPQNIIVTCRREHDEIHATQEPPAKPSRQEMLRALGREVIAEVITEEADEAA